MREPERLIPVHGGYRKLKSFQVAQLVYDVTVRFCQRYVDKRSRTHDQMVQAARSGVQNIAEGSQASGTSKKTELKLTNVARASLEELRLDYEDFLRQRGLPQWPRADARRAQLIALRPSTADDVAAWARAMYEGQCGQDGRCEQGGQCGQDGRRGPSGQDGRRGLRGADAGPPPSARARSIPSTPSTKSNYPEIAANGALALVAVACSLLDRQIASLERAFVEQGGFTERLYRVRTEHRRSQSTP